MPEYLFVCGLVNDAASSTDYYIVSDDGMIMENEFERMKETPIA
jgi:hypothetical protein